MPSCFPIVELLLCAIPEEHTAYSSEVNRGDDRTFKNSAFNKLLSDYSFGLSLFVTFYILEVQSG